MDEEMLNFDIILTEKCGSTSLPLNYIRKDQNSITVQQPTKRFTRTITDIFRSFLREIFLPHGYPDSVSVDYFNYQFWDTIQAFCSTITGIFTTRAILKGVGVGNAEASTLSATITWVLKDGTGMLGKVLFAWWNGRVLDSNCKKWRLFADILNDAAMLLELAVPYALNFGMGMLCGAQVMKAIVGVAGGATRASITQHQAIRGNMAEVSAKDGSQETLVNLIASFVGIFLLNWLDLQDCRIEWCLIGLLIMTHLFANYRAVTSLVFQNLNNARMALVLKDYLVVNAISGPHNVNARESVFLGCGLAVKEFCGFRIVLGKSLKNICTKSLYDYERLKFLTNMYGKRKYLIVPDIRQRKIYITFEANETSENVIEAYFHATLLGIKICIYNYIPLDIYTKRQLHHTSPITRLKTFMKTFQNDFSTAQMNLLPLSLLSSFDEFVEQEIKSFFIALDVSGWNVTSHSLEMDGWRANWKDVDKKNL